MQGVPGENSSVIEDVDIDMRSTPGKLKRKIDTICELSDGSLSKIPKLEASEESNTRGYEKTPTYPDGVCAESRLGDPNQNATSMQSTLSMDDDGSSFLPFPDGHDGIKFEKVEAVPRSEGTEKKPIGIPVPRTLEELEARRLEVQKLIRQFQAERGRKMQPSPEPPRNKTHWDYVLEEMVWMSNDFQREKKMKIKLAKKLSKAVMAFHERVQHSEERKEQAMITAKKKLALQASRMIKKFWSNISRLVMFKHKEKFEKKKQQVQARHLEVLVGQTEQFTAVLATDLQRQTEASKLLVEAAPAPPSEETQAPVDTKVGSKKRGREAVDDANDAEVKLADLDDESDDEATLDEEEKMVDERVYKEEVANEMSDLKNEADMPIEELLKKYGYAKGSESEDGSDASDDEGDEGDDADEEEEKVSLANTSRSGRFGSAASSTKEDKKSSSTEEARITAAADKASAAQPTGFDFATTKVKTKVPHLLRSGNLREYQHIGLDWLLSMYDNKLNGILADEMGLGKTIMTIAMIAYLACERGIWGQHLIVVPTSVMMNWELEFKRWCPGLKILCYYGSAAQRKLKRKGWNDPESFHVVITSYQLILKDQPIFRRKKMALPDPGRGSADQELQEPALAELADIPNRAKAATDGNAPTKQHDGAVVIDALPHARCFSIAGRIQGLVFKPSDEHDRGQRGNE